MQRSGDAPPLPPQHQHLRTEGRRPAPGRGCSAARHAPADAGNGCSASVTLLPLRCFHSRRAIHHASTGAEARREDATKIERNGAAGFAAALHVGHGDGEPHCCPLSAETGASGGEAATQKGSSPPPLTHLPPPDMTAQSGQQSSRIRGQRRAAGRADSTARGGSADRQQPGRGRIAVSGDERQGQCGSQQTVRGEEAAEVCDLLPPEATLLAPPQNRMVHA